MKGNYDMLNNLTMIRSSLLLTTPELTEPSPSMKLTAD